MPNIGNVVYVTKLLFCPPKYKIPSSATNCMDLEYGMLSERTDTEKQISYGSSHEDI